MTSPMTRRFQFSVRALLVGIVIACIALGLWRAYVPHYSSFVEAGPAVVGKPFATHGRVFVFGSHPSAFTVEIALRGVIQEQSLVDFPEDVTWGAYEFDVEMSEMTRPGDYDIQIRIGSDVIARGPAIVAPSAPVQDTGTESPMPRP